MRFAKAYFRFCHYFGVSFLPFAAWLKWPSALLITPVVREVSRQCGGMNEHLHRACIPTKLEL